jgi:hypothetical protein
MGELKFSVGVGGNRAGAEWMELIGEFGGAVTFVRCSVIDLF